MTTVGVERVELSPPDATVSVQGRVRLSAAVLGEGGRPLAGRAVEWSSVDRDVAEVEQDGTVLGIAPGTTTIRASSEGVSGTASVTVTPRPSVRLTPSAVEFVAVQNGASPGDRTINVTNAGGGTLGSLSAAVRHMSGPAGWLAASISGATAPAALVLNVSQIGLPAGTYTAVVEVASPLADNSPASAQVTLTVLEPQPAIGLGATSLSFAAAQGGANPAQQTVGVTNAGRGTLSGLSATVDYAAGQPAGWLTAELNGTTAPTTMVLQARTGGLSAGTYSAGVRIASGVAQNSPQTVTVSFTVGAAQPVIVREPTQLSFAGRVGGANPPARTVEIGNAGGGTLSGLSVATTYAPGQPSGWLAANLNGTTAPASLTVAATTGQLPAGTYSAVLHIAAPEAANNPQMVPVTFEVAAAAPIIVVSAATASFAATRTGGNPAPVQIAVTNAGGGELTGLATAISYPAGQPTGWLSAALSGGTAPATLTLTASRGSLPVGTYSATVALGAPSASNTPVTIGATLTVTEGALLAPGAPGGLSATAVSTSRVNLSWSAASGAVAEYRLERKTGTGGSYALVETLSATTLGFADTGLNAATQYVYRVQACNAGGCSPYSGEASATTQAPGPTAPGAPGGLSAAAVSASRINLSWSAASGAVAEYRLERKTGTGGSYALVETLSATTLGFADTGLNAATQYVYRVQACNAGGCSPYSGEASATTQAPGPVAPGVPGSLSATAASMSRIDVAWSGANGTVTEYRLERKTGQSGSFAGIATLSGSTLSYSDTGLTPGTTYVYRVRACNEGACSAYSGEASATTQSLLAPAAPSGLSATGVSTSRIDLAWSHTGLPLVDRFEIERAPQTDPTAFSAVATTGASARSHADTGLPEATAFVYRVRACNVIGCSPWVQASGSTLTRSGQPDTPSNVTASADSRTAVTVSWTPPGGQTRYEIRRRTGTGGMWTFSAEAAGSATSYRDTGLTPGTTYQYQVRACASSCSEYSSPATVATQGSGDAGEVNQGTNVAGVVNRPLQAPIGTAASVARRR